MARACILGNKYAFGWSYPYADADYLVLSQLDNGLFRITQAHELIADGLTLEAASALIKLMNQDFINNTGISSQMLTDKGL